MNELSPLTRDSRDEGWLQRLRSELIAVIAYGVDNQDTQYQARISQAHKLLVELDAYMKEVGYGKK